MRARSALALLLSSLAAACQTGQPLKVDLPSSDSSPPSLVWNVYSFNTGVQADHPGSPTLGAHHGEHYRITLKANDPQGVKQIQLNPSLGSGEISWTCHSTGGEPLGQSKTATLGPMTQDLSPDSSGQVLTGIFLMQELDIALDCQSGWSFQGGQVKLTGRATNYFGGVTTETFHMQVAP
jgi:hypothetical protein